MTIKCWIRDSPCFFKTIIGISVHRSLRNWLQLPLPSLSRKGLLYLFHTQLGKTERHNKFMNIKSLCDTKKQRNCYNFIWFLFSDLIAVSKISYRPNTFYTNSINIIMSINVYWLGKKIGPRFSFLCGLFISSPIVLKF